MYIRPLIRILGLGLLLLPSCLLAQIDDDGTELFRPFRATLAESKRREAQPPLPPIDTARYGKVQYQVPTRLLSLAYPPPVIRPNAMPQPTVERYGLCARAGIGYPLSPLFELSYYNKEEKRMRYGASLSHHSGQGTRTHQNFGNTQALGHFSYMLDQGLAVGGELHFGLRALRFYGLGTDSTDLPKDSVAQRFSQFGAKIFLYNHRENSLGLNYRLDVDFYRLGDAYRATETGIGAQADLSKRFGSRGQHQVAAALFANSLAFNNSGNTQASDSLYQSRALVYVLPRYTLNSQKFALKLGFNAGLAEGKGFFYPDAQVDLSLAEGKFVAYAGSKGEILQNSLRSLSQYNPFINTGSQSLVSNLVFDTLQLRHTRQLAFYGGLRGRVRKGGYDLQVGLRRTQNLALFLNDSLQAYRRFKVVYDTATIFYFKGSFDLPLTKELSFTATAQYQGYSLRVFDKAYHLPVLEANLAAQYLRQSEKGIRELRLRAEIFTNVGVPYFDPLTRTNKTLSGLFDVNLYASCYFTPKIGAFLSLNNILNNTNQRWFRYPQIGFNAMLGVQVRL